MKITMTAYHANVARVRPGMEAIFQLPLSRITTPMLERQIEVKALADAHAQWLTFLTEARAFDKHFSARVEKARGSRALPGWDARQFRIDHEHIPVGVAA
jgi:hypothetical protein